MYHSFPSFVLATLWVSSNYSALHNVKQNHFWPSLSLSIFRGVINSPQMPQVWNILPCTACGQKGA